MDEVFPAEICGTVGVPERYTSSPPHDEDAYKKDEHKKKEGRHDDDEREEDVEGFAAATLALDRDLVGSAQDVGDVELRAIKHVGCADNGLSHRFCHRERRCRQGRGCRRRRSRAVRMEG
jgi:hypothetical protein